MKLFDTYLSALKKQLESMPEGSMFLSDDDIIHNPTITDENGKIFVSGSRDPNTLYVLKYDDEHHSKAFTIELFEDRIKIYKLVDWLPNKKNCPK
jgi:hypothetical protein